MIKNIKLKNRILLGYALPVTLFLGATTTVFIRVNQARVAFNSVRDASAVLENIQGAAYHFATIQNTARGYLLQKTDTSLNAYQRSVTAFKETSELVSDLIVDPQQQERAMEIISLGEEVVAYNNNLIQLVDRGRADEAVSIWREGGGRQLAQRLEELLTEFMTEELAILEERSQTEEAILNSVISSVVVISLIAIVASLALGFWIADIITKRVNETVNQVVTTSNQITVTIGEQERTISEQASSVNETTTTVEELGATTRQTAQQADVSGQRARQALDLTEKGTESVNLTMEGINDLQNKVNAIADRIVNLSEQTGQISDISNLVTDIANETNMLALNAAVEAARAGEQGKGFTVVAGEIRKLAEQSKKSAERIDGLVEDIQAAINSTIMVTDQGQKTAIQGIQLAQNSATTFKDIADAVNNVFINSQQISMSSKQQAVAVQQVVSAMNAINLGAQETTTGIGQVKNAAGELNQSATNLKQLV